MDAPTTGLYPVLPIKLKTDSELNQIAIDYWTYWLGFYAPIKINTNLRQVLGKQYELFRHKVEYLHCLKY